MSTPIQPASTNGCRARHGLSRQESSNNVVGADQKLTALMRASQNGDRAAYISLLQQLVPVLQRFGAGQTASRIQGTIVQDQATVVALQPQIVALEQQVSTFVP